MGPSVTLGPVDGRNTSFRLLDARTRQRIGFADGRRRFLAAHRLAAARPGNARAPQRAGGNVLSMVLKPSGGKLALRAPAAAASEALSVPCGDVDRTRGATPGLGAPVLRFKPAMAIEAEPLAREIHAVTTSEPDGPGAGNGAPSVRRRRRRQRRLEQDQRRFADRRAVRSRLADGGRRPHHDTCGASWLATGPELLAATGTVYLPPIGRNDPLLPELLALAFIGGLRRKGNVTTDPSLKLSPSGGGGPIPAVGGQPVTPISVVRGEPARYELEISGTCTFTIKRTFELITGADGSGDMSFRSLDVTLAQQPALPSTVTVESPPLTRPESQVAIQVLMLLEIGTLARVAVSTLQPVNLTDA